MKVAIIGCGYVGLVTGVGLAIKGHKVTAIDINPSRVEQVKDGLIPFYEPGVKEALRKVLAQKTFQVSNSIEDIKKCSVILICVQTPPKKNGAIDLQILVKVAKSLASVFIKHSGPRIVVVRSTIIPGTTDKIITPIFQRNILPEIGIAFNPEFLREGSALEDFLNPDRIVIGTYSIKAKRVLTKLYAPFKTPIIYTTPSTAELSKYTSNTLLATLVSFSNEIARICERTSDADVEDVLAIVHLDKRFRLPTNGSGVPAVLSYLKAGCGFGGSCFPKDLSALIAYASSKGEDPRLLKAVETININQPIRVVDMASRALRGLIRRRIAVLGVAFKGGTDDLRESPGLRIVDELLKRKASVTIYDPLVNTKTLNQYIDKGVIIASNLKDATKGINACIIASNAPEFYALEQWQKKSHLKHLKIIDGRRIIKSATDRNREYYGVGRAISERS